MKLVIGTFEHHLNRSERSIDLEMMMSAYSMRLITVLVATFVVFTGPVDAAGTAAGVTIDRMMMDTAYDEKLFIKVSGVVSTPNACSIHSVWNFVLDTSTPLGTQMYAILLNAHAHNIAINLIGADNCNVYTGIETLKRTELL